VSISLRSLLFAFLVLPGVAPAALTPAPVQAVNNRAKPVVPPAPPAQALPATLDVVTFLVHTEGANHKLIVTTAPNLMRVDCPSEAYSIIYNPETESYIGLEHSNYTYWQFSWPEIRSVVENSKRYASRLQELSFAGVSPDAPSAPAPPAPAANTNVVSADAVAAIVPDTSGYVWRQTNEHKNIAGLDCVQWIGETVSGDKVQAWCVSRPLPKILDAVTHLRAINEPMALVAIRSLAPPFVFPIFSALTKGGVTPILIIWGGDRQKNSFAFVEAKTRDAKADLFAVPKLYRKTTLVSMDGMVDQK